MIEAVKELFCELMNELYRNTEVSYQCSVNCNCEN